MNSGMQGGMGMNMNNMMSQMNQMSGMQQMGGMNPGGMGGMQQMGNQFPNMGGQQSSTQNSGAQLYVGNLDNDITEQRLHEVFAGYGNITNVRIMRDLYSSESRGFGFVTFSSQQDAQRAKLVLNHTKISDNVIRICFKRNPSDNNQNANLYLKNIDPKLSPKEIEEYCGEFGTVHSCKIKIDEFGNNCGYGYIQFESEEQATECLNKMNNLKLGDRELVVEKFIPRNKRTSAIVNTNLYIKSFPSGWERDKIESYLKEHFGVYGKIASQGVFKDNKVSKYYAFVAYEKDEEAQNAQKELNNLEVDGEKLYVNIAQSKNARKQMLKQSHLRYKNDTNLFVRSIQEEVTDARFKEIFGKFGEITSSYLKLSVPKAEDPTKITKPLKFGFVNYKTDEMAKNAFTEAKKDLEVQNMLDSVSSKQGEFIFYAQPKAMRAQYLKMQRKNMKVAQMFTANMQMLMQMYNPRMMMGGFNRKRGGNNMGQNYQGQNRNRGGGFNRGMNRNNMMGNNMNQMNMASMFGGQGGQGGMNPMMQGGNMGMGGAMGNNLGGGNNLPNNLGGANANLGGANAQIPNMNNMGNMGNMGQLLSNTQTPIDQSVNLGNLAPTQAQSSQQETRNLEWLKTNLTTFENLEQSEKKQLLGNLMYLRVSSSCNENTDLIPKITGMLIDLEVLGVNEIIEIMENDEILKERIEEAVSIIKEDEEEEN